jgi:hypothetical protein
MLGLQASTLEQQERAFKNQIRLGFRQILQQELQFYNGAFNTMASCASILAGFSYTGLLIDPYTQRNHLQPDFLTVRQSELAEALFNLMCTLTTCMCLVIVVYSNYLSLFATRLALRGGESSVEIAVSKTRTEYTRVLKALTVRLAP